MYDITLKKIEHYLYYYNLMDYKISLLKEEHEDCNYKQTYKIWIKNQWLLKQLSHKNILQDYITDAKFVEDHMPILESMEFAVYASEN